MAPVYKLKYYDVMGLAEPIRYMLAYGNTQYEQVVVDETQWPAMRKTVPFAKIPVLEVGGKVLFNSTAICRFLGHQYGLVTTDEWTNAEIYAIAETVYDFGTKVAEWHHEKNQTIRTMRHKDLDTYTIPTYLKGFEDWLLKKGGFFGGKMSWVDLYFVAMMDTIEGMWGMQLIQNEYPHLHELVLKVRGVPAIKAYLEKRPHHDH